MNLKDFEMYYVAQDEYKSILGLESVLEHAKEIPAVDKIVALGMDGLPLVTYFKSSNWGIAPAKKTV